MFLRKGLPLLAIMVGIFVSNKSDAMRVPPAKKILFESLKKTEHLLSNSDKSLEKIITRLYKEEFSSNGNKVIVTVADNQLHVKIVDKDGERYFAIDDKKVIKKTIPMVENGILKVIDLDKCIDTGKLIDAKDKGPDIFDKTGSISCLISKDGFESLEKRLWRCTKLRRPYKQYFAEDLQQVLYFEIFKAAYLYLVDSKDQVAKNAFFEVMAGSIEGFVSSYTSGWAHAFLLSPEDEVLEAE